MRTTTSSRASFALLASGLLIAGCGWISRSVEILDVQVSPDGTTLEMEVDSCGAELSTEVKEDAQSVAVYVGARKGSGAGCTDRLLVELEDPLGGRRLIDGYDFTVVEVGFMGS